MCITIVHSGHEGSTTSEFRGGGSKGEVHDSDKKMGEHGECRNLQGVVSRLLLQG